MVLSRFWSVILAASILYLLAMLATGRLYTVAHVVNGKLGDPVIVAEIPAHDFQLKDPVHFTSLQTNKPAILQFGDTVYQLTDSGIVEVSIGRQRADGIFVTCKNTIFEIWLPLIGYLTFFCGLLHLLGDSDAMAKLARFLTPLFQKLFPEIPAGHPAYGYMTMNFAANFLGLDNAATPFGLKAMESMQEASTDKSKASDSQIMFLCLHAAGLTLLPTSIIGYRAAQHAANPSDIMVPTIITSFTGTLAALLLVGLKQRIQLLNWVILLLVGGTSAAIGLIMSYITRLSGVEKLHFTGNLGNGLLLFIILAIVIYSLLKENAFHKKNTNIFDSFVTGARDGFATGLRVLPYMIGMLVALSIFRNSGLMDMAMVGISSVLGFFHVAPWITDAIPVALMRPFSPGGSRGFMLDAMKTYGTDSLTGQLACLFQGAAETTFYVIALYFGSVNVKDTRYTLAIMLLVDLVCVLTAILVCRMYF